MVPVLDSTKKYLQSEDLGSQNRQANQVYIFLYRESRIYLLYIKTYHTQENGHEINQREIRVWKYVRTGINAYLKNQVESHSKIDNSGNNQKTVQNFQVYFIQVLEGKYK